MTGVLLETERLTVRRLTDADFGQLTELDSDPAVTRFITGAIPEFDEAMTFHADWLVRIPGDEHGDVEYAVTREEWEQNRLREAAPGGR